MGSSRICWPELMEAAREAADHAVVPSSGFRVGSALLVRGQVYRGANLEHLLAPGIVGTCAERSALSRIHYDRGEFPMVNAVAIFMPQAQTPGTPCGICRAALHAAAAPGLLIRSACPGEQDNTSAGFADHPGLKCREWRFETLYPVAGRLGTLRGDDRDPRDTQLEWERLVREDHPGVMPLSKEEEAFLSCIDPRANTLKIKDVPVKHEHGHLPSVVAGDRKPMWAALVFKGRKMPVVGYETIDATTRLGFGPVHSAVQQVLSTGNARRKGRRLKFVLVYSPTTYLPPFPGTDRQILYELTAKTPKENTNRKVPIILTCAGGYTVKTSLDFLLPEPFGPNDLGY